MLKVTTKRAVYATGVSAKPASAPKLATPVKSTATKTFYPIGPVATSPVAVAADEPEITAAMTSSNARNRLVNAVKHGHGLWRLQAKFRDLKIMAASAIGSPGCLDGPELGDLIDTYPDVQSLTGLEIEIYEAVRDGAAACFEAWRENVTVPGLPWYPAFVAYPGPMAPPTPNVPMPLMSCVSSQLGKFTPTALSGAMKGALRDELKTDSVKGMLDQIGQSLSAFLMTWLPSQQVMLVMGKGPVPSFAPPYVPVGPVVGGDNIATPGHLAT